MQSCPSPIVYFPLLTPSWPSKASCTTQKTEHTTQPRNDKNRSFTKQNTKLNLKITSLWQKNIIRDLGDAGWREVYVHGKDSHIGRAWRGHWSVFSLSLFWGLFGCKEWGRSVWWRGVWFFLYIKKVKAVEFGIGSVSMWDRVLGLRRNAVCLPN